MKVYIISIISKTMNGILNIYDSKQKAEDAMPALRKELGLDKGHSEGRLSLYEWDVL